MRRKATLLWLASISLNRNHSWNVLRRVLGRRAHSCIREQQHRETANWMSVGARNQYRTRENAVFLVYAARGRRRLFSFFSPSVSGTFQLQSPFASRRVLMAAYHDWRIVYESDCAQRALSTPWHSTRFAPQRWVVRRSVDASVRLARFFFRAMFTAESFVEHER